MRAAGSGRIANSRSRDPRGGDVHDISGAIWLPSRTLCPIGPSWGAPAMLAVTIGAANCDPCVRDRLEGFSVSIDAGGEIAIRHWRWKH